MGALDATFLGLCLRVFFPVFYPIKKRNMEFMEALAKFTISPATVSQQTELLSSSRCYEFGIMNDGSGMREIKREDENDARRKAI
jgi:hypothetical protein